MNKTYIIVGASSGIGKALAMHLIKNGNKIINFSRNPLEVEGVVNHTFDILTNDFPALENEIHGLAYLPGSISLKPFKSFKQDEFKRDMEINYFGAIRFIQAYLPKLQKSDSVGSILLFSTVAVQTGMSFHSSIAGAKGAVEGLIRALSAELAPKIRVNGIAPSLTDTPLAAGLLNNEVKLNASKERHPLKTIGLPEDMSSLGAYLLSEESKFITGQIFKVDGGLSTIR